MKLSEWQRDNEISDIALGIKLGIHPSHISHIKAGRKRPSPQLALKIEEITKGNVTIMELLYPQRIELH